MFYENAVTTAENATKIAVTLTMLHVLHTIGYFSPEVQ